MKKNFFYLISKLNTEYLNILKYLAIVLLIVVFLYYINPTDNTSEIIGFTSVMAFFLSLSDYFSVLFTYTRKINSRWDIFWGILILISNLIVVLILIAGIMSLIFNNLFNTPLFFKNIVSEVALFSGLSMVLFMFAIAGKEELVNGKKLNNTFSLLIIVAITIFISMYFI
ncbi:hypothetical protein ACIQW7_24480 [Peribacillus simplex]|uniref:hypothetical protein n=1 Tax=Peribacillus simplex TaxID=1478 RepID=UPI0038038832